jgi:hypothetical protein
VDPQDRLCERPLVVRKRSSAEGARRASEVEDINGELMRPGVWDNWRRRDHEIGLSPGPLEIAPSAT